MSATDLQKSIYQTSAYWRHLRSLCLFSDDNREIVGAEDKHSLWPLIHYRQVPLERDARNAISTSEANRFISICSRALRGIELEDPAQWQIEVCLESRANLTMARRSEISGEASNKLKMAIEAVQAIWPDLHSEMMTNTWAIAWIRPQETHLQSFSDPKRFGMIHLNAEYFSRHPFLELATALVHESAHHTLFVETSLDRLFKSGWSEPLFSPIRKQIRPAIGVLHGLFACYRMNLWGMRLRQHFGAAEMHVDEAKRIDRCYSQGFRETCGQLLKQDLTDRGRSFITSLLADESFGANNGS